MRDLTDKANNAGIVWITGCDTDKVTGKNSISNSNNRSKDKFCAMDLSPGKYYEEMKTKFGEPTYCVGATGNKNDKSYNPGKCVWAGDDIHEKTGAFKLTLKNELIAHKSPMPHVDYIYSTAKIDGLNPERASKIAYASGSIMVDQLKGEVTARCGKLLKNQVTLNFANNVASGKYDNICANGVAEIYSMSIKNNILSDSFPDAMGEK